VVIVANLIIKTTLQRCERLR